MKQSNRSFSLFKSVSTTLAVLLVFVIGYAKFARTHTNAAEPQALAGLQQIIDNWVSQQSFNATVSVQELSGDSRAAGHLQSSSMATASTFKLYVAYATLYQIEQGKYSLSTVTSDGKTIQTDLTNMIVNSDNDASRTLGFMLGWQNINDLLKGQGLTATNLNNYNPASTDPIGDKHSTAADFTTFLGLLNSGKLLNQDDTEYLLGLMERQNYRERVPAGVPSSITVADKPGWLKVSEGDGENVQDDAAIVYGPKSTYVLVIMTNGTNPQPLANLSGHIYDYLET